MQQKRKTAPPGKRLKPAQQTINKLDTYRPVRICPQNWAVLLKNDHPVGGWLDIGRA